MKQSMVKFWGVRGSIPAPGPNTVFYGGNTACVEVRVKDQIFVLDAGTGIRELGRSLGAEFGEKPINLNLLLTHTHWDHIQGFPFFLPAYDPKNSIAIYGFDTAEQRLKNALSFQMVTPYFPIQLEKMAANITFNTLSELSFCVNHVPIKAHFLNHPGICTAYRLFSGERSIAYLPDVELPYRPSGKQTTHTPETLEQEANLVEFLKGTEILIIDSQYSTSEYETHAGWGHTCVEDSVALAIRAKVRQLFLFHHDPDHTDAQIDELVASARALAKKSGASLIVEAAREGLEIEL